MDLVVTYQGVDGRVFGNENSGSSEDRIEKVRRVTSRMRRGRTIGSDAIPVEFWKGTVKESIEWLTRLFNAILKTGKMPDEWKKSTMSHCTRTRAISRTVTTTGTCSRAATVLSHIIKDNKQCKEKVLHIELEDPTHILARPEPLLHRMVKHLALASSMKSNDGKSSTSENVFVQLIFLKLLIIWLSDCPNAVQCFLESRPHLTYLLKLVSNPTTTVSVRGLAAVLLGECVIYNKSNANGKDAYSIFDAISQKVGLTSYFLKYDEMQKDSLFTSAKPFMPHKPLTRSSAASMAEIEDGVIGLSDQKNEHPMLTSVFDSPFVYFLKRLEADIREKVVEAYNSPKSQVTVVPAELEQRSGENGVDYIKRLKTFVEKQCHEIQNGGIETLKAEAMKESEAEFNDLLVCLGQEQSKVDKLSTRLRELGEDVDKLLEDTGDDVDVDADEQCISS